MIDTLEMATFSQPAAGRVISPVQDRPRDPIPFPGLRTTRVAVVGAGYWGPKLIRNFAALPEAELAMVCDLAPERLQAVAEQYPDTRTTTDFQALLDSDVEAVAIATPVMTHYSLVKQALEAGKHVLVEKPLTMTTREAEEVVELARQQDRLLMVGHTFLFEPAVERLCELVRDGELGDVWHVTSERRNLGLFRHDANVLWDLAPHDVSILLAVLGTEPTGTSARGACHVQPGIHDVAYIELRFPDDVMAHVHVSWLDPGKVRRLTVVGSKKMAIYDDTAPDKLCVFDRGVERASGAPGGLSYRQGEATAIPLPSAEPLRRQCAYFVERAQRVGWSAADAEFGLRIVRILEQADRSLQTGGHRRRLVWGRKGCAEVLAPTPAWEHAAVLRGRRAAFFARRTRCRRRFLPTAARWATR
jgi:predicted dehydrogenase